MSHEEEIDLKKDLIRLYHIGGSIKMLIIVILSVLSFIISTILLIKFTQIEIVVPAQPSLFGPDEYTIKPFGVPAYLSILISTITPLIWILIYIGAKQRNNEMMAKTVHAAYVILRIGMWAFSAIFVILGFLLISEMIVNYGEGIIAFVMYLLVFIYVIFIIQIFIRFLRDLENNLYQTNMTKRANPEALKIIYGLSVFISIVYILIYVFTSPAETNSIDFEYVKPFIEIYAIYEPYVIGISFCLSLTIFLLLNKFQKEFTHIS
ncbi:MAG: hypothetical protein AB7E61_03045 [Acholeplasmataceae bacterium]